MNKLVAVIIGGGKISEQHLSAMRHIDGVSVAAVCDLSPALARFTAERFSVPYWYTDYRKMLEETDADVVHVLTPPATHERLVGDCLETGRHVIVEKPIALSRAGFLALWETAAKKGVCLVENHNYRFNEPVRQIEQAIARGHIGHVEEVEVRITLNIRSGGRYADENLPHPSHRLPAGIIHEFITHLAYLLLHFFPDGYDCQFDTIASRWSNHGGGDLFRYDDLDALILAGNTHGRIRFTSRQWPDSFEIYVRGSDGIASAEIFNPVCRITTRRPVGQHLTPLVNAFSNAGTLMKAGLGAIWNKIRNRGPYEGLARFLHQTYAALRLGQAPPVTFAQMDGTIRLVDQLLAEENRL